MPTRALCSWRRMPAPGWRFRLPMAADSPQEEQGGDIRIADVEFPRVFAGLEQIQHELKDLIPRLLPGEIAISTAQDFRPLDEIEQVGLLVEVGDDRGNHGLELGPR